MASNRNRFVFTRRLFFKKNNFIFMVTRVCKRCELTKDLEKDFHKKKTNEHSKNTICKECCKTHSEKVKAEKKGEWFNFN